MSLRAFAIGSLLCVAGVAQAEIGYGLTEGGLADDLVQFDTSTPGTTTLMGTITGLPPGNTLRAIDFRPSNGKLYALSTAPGGQYNLFTVNLQTAELTFVGGGVVGNNFGWPIRVSMDFDPVRDELRVITIGVRNNFRINANNGALIAEDSRVQYASGDVNFGTNVITADIAFDNNVVGATSSTLYVFDYSVDSLCRLGGVGGTPNPATGELRTIGEAVPGDFLTLSAATGLDISGATGVCYLSHDDAATGTIDQLSTLNLATGVATLVGTFDRDMQDIAILPRTCDTIDFNNNQVFPEDQDVIDFFNVLSGADCAACNDIDFNNNGVFPEDQDVIDFFTVLAGGQCGT